MKFFDRIEILEVGGALRVAAVDVELDIGHPVDLEGFSVQVRPSTGNRYQLCLMPPGLIGEPICRREPFESFEAANAAGNELTRTLRAAQETNAQAVR